MALDPDEQVTAFAIAEPVAAPVATAEICYVGVDPGHWGFGLGRAIMTAMTAELTAAGFARAQLLVYAGNTTAVRLYEHLGWQAEGQPRPHARTAKPEQRYRLTLGAR